MDSLAQLSVTVASFAPAIVSSGMLFASFSDSFVNYKAFLTYGAFGTYLVSVIANLAIELKRLTSGTSDHQYALYSFYIAIVMLVAVLFQMYQTWPM